jgi:S1-C subfamily serine protease
MRRSLPFGVLGLAVVLAGWAFLSSRETREAPPAEIAGGAAWPNAARSPPDAPPSADGESAGASPASSRDVREADAVDTELDGDASNAGSGASRVDLLVGAGFTRDRAEQIVQRDRELRRAAVYREYETTGTVRPLSGGAQLASDVALRQELGDADFERYLAASGRPTRVVVAGVAAGSSAAHAGLMPGDEVLAYGGERVFNFRELNELALKRSIGETVATTVVREGQTLQLFVTGGPLGVTLR